MTKGEARKNLKRWETWKVRVEHRWLPGSPMVDLAHRRVLEARLRLMEILAAER